MYVNNTRIDMRALLLQLMTCAAKVMQQMYFLLRDRVLFLIRILYLHLVDVPLGIFHGIPLETIRCLPVGLYAVPRRFHGHYHVGICSPLVSVQCYR